MSETDYNLNRKLKHKIFLWMVVTTIGLVLFAIYYISLSLHFSPTDIWYLTASATVFTVIALSADFFLYDLITSHIRHFAKTNKKAFPAYRQTLLFPVRYALICEASYYFVILGVIIYMALAIGLDRWNIINIFIAGSVVAIPEGLTVYFISRELFIPITKRLFHESKIASIARYEELGGRSLKNRIVLIIIIISINAYLATGGFFFYTLANPEIPDHIFRGAIKNVAIISCFNLVLMVGVGIMLSRHITSPLRIIEANLHNIALAAGDLCQKAEIITLDEIGRIGGWLNVFLSNMQKLLLEVHEKSDKVSEVAELLVTGSKQINAASEDITHSVQIVTDGAGQQLAQMNSVASLSENIENDAVDVLAATESAERIIGNVVDSALKGGEEGKKSIESIGILALETNRTVRTMKVLGEKINQIGTITEAIENISSQTKLLALNAAIESARAGKYGAGFGVIAQEIRKLNDDTNAAAKKITNLIMTISQSTNAMIEQITNVSQEATGSKETIEKSGYILLQIASSIGQGEEAVKSISELANSQRSSLKEASTLVEDTAKIADSNANVSQNVLGKSEAQVTSVEEMSTAARNLADVADQLKQLLARFKISNGQPDS